MNRLLTATLILLLLAAGSVAFGNELFVINGLGETADHVDLDLGTVDHNVTTLGLVPNDILVNGALGVAVNSGSSDLYLYDLPALSSAGNIWLGSNRNPWSGAWLDGDTLVVTNWQTSTISVVALAAQSVVAEHPIGDPDQNINHPQSIVIVDRKAYIAMSDFDTLYQYHPGFIEVFDLDGDSTLTRIAVDLNPQDVVLGHDGYLYAVCSGDYFAVFGKLYRIDPAGDTLVDSLAVGGQPAAITTTSQGIAYLAAGGWSKSGALPNKLNPLASGSAAAARGNGGLVYTVDLESWQILHGSANPLHTNTGAVNVTTVSDSSVMVCCFQDDIIVEIDSAGQVLTSYSTGDGPTALGKYPVCFLRQGDPNGDDLINITDAVYLIQYIFNSGPAPVLLTAGDVNDDSLVNITDAVYLVQYIFNSGPEPVGCCD